MATIEPLDLVGFIPPLGASSEKECFEATGRDGRHDRLGAARNDTRVLEATRSPREPRRAGSRRFGDVGPAGETRLAQAIAKCGAMCGAENPFRK